MNRCEVCDKTDEEDRRASISFDGRSMLCQECRQSIFNNITELELNAPLEVDYLDTFLLPATEQDDHWIEASMSQPDVQEQ